MITLDYESMESLVQYFWLFIVEPAKFTSEWDLNNIDLKYFLFTASFIMIIAQFIYHIFDFYYSNKNNKITS